MILKQIAIFHLVDVFPCFPNCFWSHLHFSISSFVSVAEQCGRLVSGWPGGAVWQVGGRVAVVQRLGVGWCLRRGGRVGVVHGDHGGWGGRGGGVPSCEFLFSCNFCVSCVISQFEVIQIVPLFCSTFHHG